jgi:glycine dehydrogenase subunit 1
MRFIPHTPADLERMLETIGVDSTKELFTSIPARILKTARLDLPAGLGEQEVVRRLEELAAANRPLATFQGAGCYNHFVPAAVHQILSRSEFATAYTPYQPEVSQGTLQACFEFQTYVSILTGMDVANASVYDGASALAEAVLMALRIAPKRERIVVSKGVHPEYRAVVETYLRGFGRGHLDEVPVAADGRTDLDALADLLADDVAAVCVGYPNVYGVVEDLTAIAELAHSRGALTVSATTEALALGLLLPPGQCGVDIAVAEGQSLGLPMSYGGPGVGLFATRREFVRQMPGRLIGQTVDEAGRRGYVLTLATREQHIRREKATSNICTNQGLAALAITVFLGLAGRVGLRELAARNAQLAHEVAARLDAEAGLTREHTAPFFNEFVVREPPGDAWFADALAHGVVPGVRLASLMPGQGERGRLLVTVTECNSPDDIDTLVHCLARRRAA